MFGRNILSWSCVLCIFLVFALAQPDIPKFFVREPHLYTREMSPTSPYKLPDLPYGYGDLEPHISKQIMELHHKGHHNTYVKNLNDALATYATALQAHDVPKQISLQAALKFNGGGHINHSLFWRNLAPAQSPETDAKKAAPKLYREIETVWGSFDTFKKSFSASLLGIQGSGWSWLIHDANSRGLRIITTKDQDPVVGSEHPIFGVDMWEHAYYLQYQNGKAAYVENIWHIINWKVAEERYQNKDVDLFEELKATLA